MIIMLDASAAMEIALNNEKCDLYKKYIQESDLVIAPNIFPSEITNVFWKYASFSKMPVEICEKGIIYCLDLVDDYLETKNLCIEVFSESIKSNHSVYDLYYLVLARRNGASVLSRDKKLKALAKELKIKVLE